MPDTNVKISPSGWNIGGDIDTHDDPLLDCLMQLVKLHGRSATRSSLSTGLPLVQNRLTVELFPRAASRAGLSARLLHRSLDKISNLQLPIVLLLQDHKACILASIDDRAEQYKILMPETGMGEQTVPRRELESIYSGYSLFVKPKFRLESEDVDKIRLASERGWFWGTLLEHWRVYRDVFVASFLINVFGLVSPFYVLNVYDRVIPNGAFETLWVLSIGITIVYLFSVVMRGLRTYFIDEAGKKANLKMSAILLQKVLDLRMEVRPQSIGSFSKNLQEFESIRDFITSVSITALIDVPFVVLALLVVWYIGSKIVFVHMGAIVLLLIYALIIQFPLQKAVEHSFKASAQKNAILVEGLSGLEAIKMLGAESQIQRAWEEAVSYINEWSNKARLLSASMSFFSFFINSMLVVAVVVYGVYMISRGDLTQGGLIALVMVSRQTIAPMSQVANLATRYHRARTALKSLNDIMKLPVERPEGKTFLHRTDIKGEIEAKNLDFAYPNQTVKTLNNISLKIKAGEKVGIIGPIGSGKTTFGKLLLGLFEPLSGMVCMDGTDIRQIDPADLRQSIGYVSQEIMLFRGTIRDNITMGAHDVDDSTILRVAELSGVSEFVKKNALGFDMEVGETGRGLSGGQRQCVAIARAMLYDPPVLVLDEPTSNMDNRTEVLLRDNLSKMIKNKTVILITHRASLLAMVDRLIVIDNGTVVADGPKTSVMEALKKGHLNI
ncbi:MAG: type I secretion system permease/ATPase [Desulfobulbales bacterium]